MENRNNKLTKDPSDHDGPGRDASQDTPMVPLPKYQSHKQVWALKIKEIVFDSDLAKQDSNRETDGSAIITPENPRYAPFKVGSSYVHKHKPEVGGYWVQYEGGYESWSPAKEFEEGYLQIQ